MSQHLVSDDFFSAIGATPAPSPAAAPGPAPRSSGASSSASRSAPPGARPAASSAHGAAMTLKDLESRLASGEPFAVTLWNEVQAVCVPDRQLAAQMAVLVVSSRPLKLPPFVAAFASGVNNREYWYRFAIADADMRPLAPPAPPAPVARPIAAPTLAQRAASASAASASAPPAARRRR